MEPQKFEQARLLQIDIDNINSVLKYIDIAKNNFMHSSVVLFRDSLGRDLSQINLKGPILNKIIDLIIEDSKKELSILEQKFSEI